MTDSSLVIRLAWVALAVVSVLAGFFITVRMTRYELISRNPTTGTLTVWDHWGQRTCFENYAGEGTLDVWYCDTSLRGETPFRIRRSPPPSESESR
jgi:hypothetical protein